MSPHRKIARYLGIRGWLLLLCAAIWGHIGLGVLLEPDNRAPVYLYEHLPEWVRVGGWWITGALAAWAAARKTHVAVAVAGLMLMPLERLGSLLWGALDYAVHGEPAELASAWYAAGWYLFLVGVVAITAHVKEPTRDPGRH
jgi:hypothetical protein